MQTDTFREHVAAFRETVKHAREKHEDEVKASIRGAIAHLDAARKAAGAHIKGNVEQDRALREQRLEHLKSVEHNAKAALKETGEHLRTTVRHIIDGSDEILTKDV